MRIDATANDLSTITFLQVRSDGVIAVGQAEDASIVLFSAAGKRLAAVGRAGAGPGEFRQIFRRAGWFGDSLWVFDRGLYRVSVIAPDGRVARIAPQPPGLGQGRETEPGARISQDFFGWLGSGNAIFMTGTRFDPAGHLHEVLMRGSAAGRFEAVIADFMLRGDCAQVSSNAFCAEPQWSAAPTGDRAAIVTASLPEQRRGAFTATLINARGDTLFSKQLAVATDRIRPADISARKLDPRELPYVRTYQRFAPMTDVVIGRDESLWIGRDGIAGRSYAVVDSTGRAIGSVALPANARVKAADPGHVWVVAEDSNGLQSVVRYRVTRPR